jgi:hypothetical protein
MEVGVTSLTDIRPDVTKTVLQKCENTLVNVMFNPRFTHVTRTQ